MLELLDPEDEGNTVLGRAETYPTAPHLRRLGY
jgi:hypothetical protein